MADADCGHERCEWNGGPNVGTVDDRTLNQAFDLLRDQQRRYVLAKLYRTDEVTTSAAGLADHVLAHDPEAPGRERVLVKLHQETLPRLADDDIIDFDSRTSTVRYRGGEPVDNILAALADKNDAEHYG